jgi:hypothetical protein
VSPERIQQILTPYLRSRDARKRRVSGAGLTRAQDLEVTEIQRAIVQGAIAVAAKDGESDVLDAGTGGVSGKAYAYAEIVQLDVASVEGILDPKEIRSVDFERCGTTGDLY